MKPASRSWMCLCNPACRHRQRLGIELVLFLQDPRRQGLRRVTRQHRDFRLRDDRSAVQFFSHIMHLAAMDFHAISQGPFMRMGSLVERQQGRVNVDHFPGPRLQQHRGHDAHESGAGDQVQFLRLQIIVERRIKTFPRRKAFVINDMS